MKISARVFYIFRRLIRMSRMLLLVLGPGILVMVADNDAGGITTYAATGAKYGYGLIWFMVVLLPVAYYIQEMTVRLGAITKRGHAQLRAFPAGQPGDLEPVTFAAAARARSRWQWF